MNKDVGSVGDDAFDGAKKRHGTCRVFLLRSQDSNLELPDPESGALLDLTV